MSTLPIRRVVLYKHGVGYFEREAAIDGDQTVSLSFKQREVSERLWFAVKYIVSLPQVLPRTPLASRLWLPALLADALNETAVVTIDGRRRRRRRASHGRWLLGRGSLFRSTFPLDSHISQWLCVNQ